jgi:hypothetical protein
VPGDYPGGGGMIKPSYLCVSLKKQGFKKVKRNYTLYFLNRGKIFKNVESCLFWLPLGAQFYVTAEK